MRKSTRGRKVQRVNEKVGERKGIKTVTDSKGNKKKIKVMKPIYKESRTLINH